ncbi:phosphoribosylglycinamide formyltransferase [Arcanobacterium ihumii]|uniref:phosphoribosylglycinamide formyltransferase n=1 Tax=Arcanobacterium ihumii TaxID=2138162 RepID=UPI000F542C62|nr:phosphoribosylglycinamide formyltransferase [Arcanobacterium ihumii]
MNPGSNVNCIGDDIARKFALAIFASGKGSNFRAICQAAQVGDLGLAKPTVLICDRDCEALRVADEYGVPSLVISPGSFANHDQWEHQLIKTLRNCDVKLVALAGFMKILGTNFLDAFPQRILNIHPSVLPDYPGVNAIRRAYADQVDSGVTVHWVDSGIDTGAVIAQVRVPWKENEPCEAFEKRIHMAEHVLYPRVIAEVSEEIMTNHIQALTTTTKDQ